MLFHTPSRRRESILCASFLALSVTAPAFAQLGQSDWIRPGDSGSQGQAQAQTQSNNGDSNPGVGWMPARHSLPTQAEVPQTAPVQQMPQQQMDPGPSLGDDGSMPWQDAPRRQRKAQQAQQQTPPADAAFRSAGNGAQDPWSLPSAQQQADLGWAKNMSSVPMSAVMPGAPSTGAKPAAKAPAKPGQTQLSGHVTQSANTLQPTSQFDPNAGNFAPQVGNMGQMRQSAGMQMNAGMTGPYGTPTTMQPQMGGVQQMGGGMQQMQPMQQMPMQQATMQQMPMQQQMGGVQQNGAMQPNMQQMNAVLQMNGMQPMNGGTQQMQPIPQQQMGAMQSAASGGMSGMGGMDPMQMLMGGAMGGTGSMGSMGGGGDTTPFDSLGKALAGAAAMGLIPSSGTQGVPGATGTYYGSSGGNGVQPGMPVQQNNGTLLPGGPMANQVTRAVNNNLYTGVGTMINLGLSRIHW
jgi:hypothetical protein